MSCTGRKPHKLKVWGRPDIRPGRRTDANYCGDADAEGSCGAAEDFVVRVPDLLVPDW